MKATMTHNTSDEEIVEFFSTEGIPEEMKLALSFMRQWLNEDRKATPMVTARDLWHWLDKDYTTFRQSEAKKREELLEQVYGALDKLEADEGWKNNGIYTGGYDQAITDMEAAIKNLLNNNK